jgi:hypothetical protein
MNVNYHVGKNKYPLIVYIDSKFSKEKILGYSKSERTKILISLSRREELEFYNLEKKAKISNGMKRHHELSRKALLNYEKVSDADIEIQRSIFKGRGYGINHLKILSCISGLVTSDNMTIKTIVVTHMTGILSKNLSRTCKRLIDDNLIVILEPCDGERKRIMNLKVYNNIGPDEMRRLRCLVQQETKHLKRDNASY